MSKLHVIPGRAIIASAALLSLALLAGCESSTKGASSAATVGATSLAPGTTTLGNPTASTLEDQIRQVGDRVHFALDHYDLSPEAEATLRQQAALLQNYPQVAVTIQGHADERGTREYNLALGERRADTVRNYLIALGIPGERISVISYGKERPECAEASDVCWAENRRGVTVANQ